MFVDNNKFSVKLKSLYDHRIYNSDVENMHQCMQLLLAKNLADITKCYLEVMVRFLTTNVVNISNDLGFLYQSYELSFTRCQKFKNLFLNYSVRNMKSLIMIIKHN